MLKFKKKNSLFTKYFIIRKNFKKLKNIYGNNDLGIDILNYFVLKLKCSKK